MRIEYAKYLLATLPVDVLYSQHRLGRSSKPNTNRRIRLKDRRDIWEPDCRSHEMTPEEVMDHIHNYELSVDDLPHGVEKTNEGKTYRVQAYGDGKAEINRRKAVVMDRRSKMGDRRSENIV